MRSRLRRRSLTNAPTLFYGSDGKEVALTAGQTFIQVVPPGTPVGQLHPALADAIGLNRATLMAVGSHDTASAFAAAPVDLLRLFEVAQRHDLDIHPASLRLVTQNLDRIDDALRAGLPRVARPEARQIQAGRDHTVGSGEADRRRVADRTRRGNSAVERIEQAPQLRPRRPERRQAFGVGVERRHQRTPGVSQGGPAQPGHERLIEMQQIEALGGEEHVDVGDQVGRRGDKLQRAALAYGVRGAREEVAGSHSLPRFAGNAEVAELADALA